MLKNLKDYVGHRVIVEWVNPLDDWKWFYVIAYYNNTFWLRGIDSPDGDRHDGDSFLAYVDTLLTMEVIFPKTQIDIDNAATEFNEFEWDGQL